MATLALVVIAAACKTQYLCCSYAPAPHVQRTAKLNATGDTGAGTVVSFSVSFVSESIELYRATSRDRRPVEIERFEFGLEHGGVSDTADTAVFFGPQHWDASHSSLWAVLHAACCGAKRHLPMPEHEAGSDTASQSADRYPHCGVRPHTAHPSRCLVPLPCPMKSTLWFTDRHRHMPEGEKELNKNGHGPYRQPHTHFG